MGKREKPATAGEKIATKHLSGSRAICLSVFMEGKLAKDVDRAVSRAVEKERARCVGLVVKARDGSRYAGFTMQTISRLLSDMEDVEQ